MEENIDKNIQSEKILRDAINSLDNNSEFEHLLEAKISEEIYTKETRNEFNFGAFAKILLILLVLTPVAYFSYVNLTRDNTGTDKTPINTNNNTTNNNTVKPQLAEKIGSSPVFYGIMPNLITATFFDEDTKECFEKCSLEDLLGASIKEMDSVRSYKYTLTEKDFVTTAGYIQHPYGDDGYAATIKYYKNNELYKTEDLTKVSQYISTKTVKGWEITSRNTKKIFTDRIRSFGYRNFFNSKSKLTNFSLVIDTNKALNRVVFEVDGKSKCIVDINRSLIMSKIECTVINGEKSTVEFTDINLNPGIQGIKFKKDFSTLNTEQTLNSIKKQLNENKKLNKSYLVYYKNTDEKSTSNIIEGIHQDPYLFNQKIEYASYIIKNSNLQREIKVYGQIKFERSSKNGGVAWGDWEYEKNTKGWTNNDFEKVSDTELLKELLINNTNWKYENIKIVDSFSENIKTIKFFAKGDKEVNKDETYFVSLNFDSFFNVTRIELTKYLKNQFVNTVTVDYWLYANQTLPPQPMELPIEYKKATYTCSTFRFSDKLKRNVTFMYPDTSSIFNDKGKVSDCTLSIGFKDAVLMIDRVDDIVDPFPLGNVDSSYTKIKTIGDFELLRKFAHKQNYTNESVYSYVYSDSTGKLFYGHPNAKDEKWVFYLEIPDKIKDSKVKEILEISDYIISSFKAELK